MELEGADGALCRNVKIKRDFVSYGYYTDSDGCHRCYSFGVNTISSIHLSHAVHECRGQTGIR